MFEKREELLDEVEHACLQIIKMTYERRPRLKRGIDFEEIYKQKPEEKSSEGK